MEETLKTCSKCHQPKPLDQFSKQSSCRTRLNPRCKECIRVVNREQYQNKITGAFSIDSIISDVKSKNDINTKNIILHLSSKTRHMKDPKKYISKVLDEVRCVYAGVV